MNIRRKLIAGLAIAYLLVLSGFIFYTNSLILRSYLDFEAADIVERTEIGLNTLELRISEIKHTTSEYASRDDTYYYIQNNMKHFINDIVSTSSFIENELNFMIITDINGSVRYSKGFDLSNLRSTQLDAATLNMILDYDSLLSENMVSGLVDLNSTPAMIVAQKITYSDEDSPSIGTVICGRYIDEIEIVKLCEYSYQNLDFAAYASSPVVPVDCINVMRINRDTISGIAPINDINGEPYLVLLAETSRDLYHQAERTVFSFYAVMITTGSLGVIVFIYLLNKMVLERILGLSEDVSSIDPRTLEAKTLCIPGDDEIAGLSRDIDGMLQTINEYQSLLTKRERMATIGETAAMVGHDLRNPLQVIYMLGSRMKRAMDKLRGIDEAETVVMEIEYIMANLNEQTSYMNKIVSDLQNFSRSIAVQVEDLNLEVMVLDVLDTLNIDENIEVTVEFNDQSEKTQLDGNYFRRVIVNLLTNAVQAMPKGGKISIKGNREGDKSIIKISDTGIGITEDNMKQLFTPLFTTKAKGTGLGLAVCKRIVEAHKGEITVSSVEGEGTTFTVTLPSNEVSRDEPTLVEIQAEKVEFIA